MGAQVLLCPTRTLSSTYGRVYCGPRRLRRFGSSSQFLNLSLSFFPGGLLNSFFHMESGTNSRSNKAMVEHLKRYGMITSNRVAQVMEDLDRGLFVPIGSLAYADTPLPIGYNATISAPHMHATCLQLLEDKLQPGMRALDVGSGTGYLTGCFALMVGAEGRVVGVEHIPELVDMSIKSIEKSVAASLLEKGSLSLHMEEKVGKSLHPMMQYTSELRHQKSRSHFWIS